MKIIVCSSYFYIQLHSYFRFILLFIHPQIIFLFFKVKYLYTIIILFASKIYSINYNITSTAVYAESNKKQLNKISLGNINLTALYVQIFYGFCANIYTLQIKYKIKIININAKYISWNKINKINNSE